MSTIYTIGHSTRTFAELVAALQAHGIGALVDIRAFPMSRRMPWFNRESLEVELPKRGIHYVWMKELGGHRKRIRDDSPNTGLRNDSFRNYADYMLTPEFAAAIGKLLATAARTADPSTAATKDASPTLGMTTLWNEAVDASSPILSRMAGEKDEVPRTADPSTAATKDASPTLGMTTLWNEAACVTSPPLSRAEGEKETAGEKDGVPRTADPSTAATKDASPALGMTTSWNEAADVTSPPLSRMAGEKDGAPGTNTVYMCAERAYFQCHRMLVSDYLTAHGHMVLHIDDEKRAARPHKLMAEAHLVDGKLIYNAQQLF